MCFVLKEHWVNLETAGNEGDGDFDLDKVKIENKLFMWICDKGTELKRFGFSSCRYHRCAQLWANICFL